MGLESQSQHCLKSESLELSFGAFFFAVSNLFHKFAIQSRIIVL